MVKDIVISLLPNKPANGCCHTGNSFLSLLWEALQCIRAQLMRASQESGSTLNQTTQHVSTHTRIAYVLHFYCRWEFLADLALLGPSVTSPMKVVTCCKKISISPPPKMFNFRLDVQIPDRFPNIGGWEKEEEGFTILFLFMGVQANFVTRFNQVDPFGEKCQTSLSSWLPWANGMAF